jgi:hypothetical protein
MRSRCKQLSPCRAKAPRWMERLYFQRVLGTRPRTTHISFKESIEVLPVTRALYRDATRDCGGAHIALLTGAVICMRGSGAHRQVQGIVGMRLFAGASRTTAKYAMTHCSNTGARTNRENFFRGGVRMYAREPLFHNISERVAQTRMSRFGAALEVFTPASVLRASSQPRVELRAKPSRS